MNKEEKYINLAEFFSTWSKDPSTKVGQVIIGDNGQVLQQGYNGLPRCIEDTEERLNNRELKYQYVVHAEKNALYNALLNGVQVKDSTMYVHGLEVCHECQKGIIQSGIKKVVMYVPNDSTRKNDWNESTSLAKEMFDEAGVEYEVL